MTRLAFRIDAGIVKKVEVVDFPAFIIIDDKGNDFFKELNLG
jgi:fumarate hydratase class I